MTDPEATLMREARANVAPLDIAVRPTVEGFAADLVGTDGKLAVAEYGAGPTELLAALVAEQRYLAEQVGHGTVAGATYLTKAAERVRRGPAAGIA
jgi:hypothetical protein